MDALLLSFGVIFLAELGDKSQLMALAFAARFPAAPVLVAITLATALVHAGSVVLGATVALAVPTNLISVVAGLAFLAFAAWTLRGDTLTAADRDRTAADTSRSVILTVGTAFFLAELGDKTMLATVTLATHESALGTWAGSTLGMVAADAIAIAVGRLLGGRLPDRAIRIGAAIAFVAFGLILIWDGLRA
ncbi:MAG TPA: TMEM165/GDT1 family protein [Candidatus Limnocylindrales bacterium]|nr:TMEM165/GDT1 family protein [Candidatus Limnocylindrales bacterium]